MVAKDTAIERGDLVRLRLPAAGSLVTDAGPSHDEVIALVVKRTGVQTHNFGGSRRQSTLEKVRQRSGDPL